MPRTARPPASPSPFYARVWRVVERIPRGRVLSYGEVARYAGSARAARYVSRALKLAKRADFPWHRVVGAGGEIRIQDPGGRRDQIARLRREGVRVDADGRFDYARYAWKP